MVATAARPQFDDWHDSTPEAELNAIVEHHGEVDAAGVPTNPVTDDNDGTVFACPVEGAREDLAELA